MSLPPPTAEVCRLVEIIGAEAALRLVEARGGTRIYVRHRPWTEIVDLIGAPATAALISAYGGCVLKVPVARAWRARIYHEQGLSQAEIARRLGCSTDTVWRILRAA